MRIRGTEPSRLLLLAAALALTGCAGAVGGVSPAPARSMELAEALSGFVWPLPLQDARGLTSPYGERGSRHHDGLDLRGRHGDPIHAVASGRVVHSGWMRGYGETVILEHGEGVTTLYAHASERWVRVGEMVSRGQPIASVGATGNASGPHLHFEVAWRGARIDPVPLLPRLR
jgi:murein DD-endopeptidase MepM/ murein hydrolase activator NlpD